MADNSEQVVLELDESDVIRGTSAANSALDTYAGKTEGALARANTAIERNGEVLVRTSDRSRSSQERLLAMYEKQAAVREAGNNAITREIAYRDQLIQRLGGEASARERVLAASQRIIAAEQRADEERLDGERRVAQERAALQRKSIVDAAEQRAGLFGKSGVARLLEEQEQTIAKLGGEATAVQAVTAAYRKMIAAEEAAAAAAKASSGFSLNYAIRGVKDVAEGRGTFAVAEAANELSVLKGMPLVLGAVAAGFAAVGFGAYEFDKKLKEIEEEPEKIRGQFGKLTENVALGNAELLVANDRLDETIAKLEHRPGDGIKLAMHEAALEAMKMRDYIGDTLDSYVKLLKEDSASKGLFGKLMGYSNTDDLEKALGGQTGYGGLMYKLRSSAPEDAAGITAQIRNKIQEDLTAAQNAKAESERQAREASPGIVQFMYGNANALKGKVNHQQDSTIEKLQQGMIITGDIQTRIKEQADNDKKRHEKDILEASAERDRKAREERDAFQRQVNEFSKRGDEAGLNPIGKVYLERNKLLEQARELGHEESNVQAIMRAGDEQVTAIFKKEWDQFEQLDSKRRDALSKSLIGNYAPTKDQFRDWQENFAAQERVAAIGVDSQRDTINRNSNRALQMVQLQGLKGPDAVNAAYQIRLGLAHQLADIEQARIDREDNAAKKIIETAEMRRDLEKQIGEAREQAIQETLVNQKRIFDEVKQQSSQLWETLFTHPSQFGGQLVNTVKNAALRPVVDKLSTATADLLSPIFGGGRSSDPIKLATDQNTSATMQNTATVYGLTAALSMLRGISPGVSFGGDGAAASPYSGGFGWSGGGGSGGGGSPFSVPGGFGGSASSPYGSDVGAFPTVMPSAGGGGARWGSPLDLGGFFGGGSPIGPGGTAGFAGGPIGFGVGGGGGLAGAFNSSRGILGGLLAGGKNIVGFGPDGTPHDEWGKPISRFGGLLGGLKSNFFNADVAASVGEGASGIAGFASSKGGAQLELAAGLPLAQWGLLGGGRGGFGGILAGFAGGALTGAGIGTMFAPGIGTLIGAGVGAAAGLLSGVGEAIAGVETKPHEAHRLIQSIYGLNIPEKSGTIQQIVQMASQFGGSIGTTVRTPQARQLIELYGMAMGQKNNLFLETPRAASLVQANGGLYQGLSYFNGSGYNYASALPTLGTSSGVIPTSNPYAASASGPVSVSLDRDATVNLWSTGTAMAIAGNPRAVAQSANNGNQASASRLQNAALSIQPNIIFS